VAPPYELSGRLRGAPITPNLFLLVGGVPAVESPAPPLGAPLSRCESATRGGGAAGWPSRAGPAAAAPPPPRPGRRRSAAGGGGGATRRAWAAWGRRSGAAARGGVGPPGRRGAAEPVALSRSATAAARGIRGRDARPACAPLVRRQRQPRRLWSLLADPLVCAIPYVWWGSAPAAAACCRQGNTGRLHACYLIYKCLGTNTPGSTRYCVPDSQVHCSFRPQEDRTD